MALTTKRVTGRSRPVPPRKKSPTTTEAKSYRHNTATVPLRPDVGTQAQFKKKKAAAIYRYDSSLAPALEWDGKNAAREQGEALIKAILDAKDLGEAKATAHKLKAISAPFLNWAGKAERLSFNVPTLPLFVHERLSTKAIIETLRGHKKDQTEQMALFADPQHTITDQVLRAYEHMDEWVNRMMLGDSLVVMNSLLHYENLGSQVQMIYMDPPYGISFGSNFQPFVRKRDVKHNDDEDMTREAEMVQAYRDTWEFGLHSYLTYLRDRLLLCRELLHRSGSIFVQISDENLHHVRELLDEVFGPENFCCLICFRKTTGANSPQARVNALATTNDFLLWYARDAEQLKYRQLYLTKDISQLRGYNRAESPDGKESRPLTDDEIGNPSLLPAGWRVYQTENLTSTGHSDKLSAPFQLGGKAYSPPRGAHWKTTPAGLTKLAAAGRLIARGNTLNYKRYLDDFPVYPLTHVWQDISLGYAADPKFYVVQTSSDVVERCLLMTTDPGDLVLDPTCGSGTTAYVAENWGRRWITSDVSRVPLALARQRILTATFPWYGLADVSRGPAGGFVFKRTQDAKGLETGGVVPHITLRSIANDEAPREEILHDRPEVLGNITRVSGPFAVEATIPTPVDWEGDGRAGLAPEAAHDYATFLERMLEVLRRSPVLRLQGNKAVTFKNIRPPAKTLSLSAEALVENGAEKPVAFVFGPENGAVSQRLVFEAAKEATAKSYSHLYVVGFGIQPTARELVENCASVAGTPATYVEATRDLQMGDLLKNMRSSQIFSVCGLPDVKLRKLKEGKYQVELLGLDVLDPVTMDVDSRSGDDVPAWLLDTDYNDLCFHVSQAFFPRTSAWENLKKALKTEYAESVWDHLAGTASAPFEAGDQEQVAVKVIDDRGNELMVVKKLSEAVK
jgi:adenine-specific DNA-methyltransferase